MDRFEAGVLLGRKIAAASVSTDIIVGLARGGVVFAAGVAQQLKKPFDTLVVKKIGSPGNPELAIGAKVPEGQTLNVRGKTIMLTDDGAATGETMLAAVRWVIDHGAKKIIVALPVAPPEVVEKLQSRVHYVIVLEQPDNFSAVGQFYQDFTQVTEQDVVRLLQSDQYTNPTNG